jgi:hypothetical protein
MTSTSNFSRPLDLSARVADESGVRAAIEQYFLGHAEDDAARMRMAFLPSAHIESMREGEFTSWPLATYCERFKGAPAADEAMRRRTIDWVDIQGNAACAKITLVHAATTFTDYFVLLKTADGWKIANKAFDGRQT